MEQKTRLIEQARELFMKLGVRSVSMDDIANQLGISKKTVYQHVADKDELVDMVLQEEIKKMQSETLDCSATARDAVDEIFNTMFMVMKHFNNMNPVIIFDLHKYHFTSWLKFMEYKNNFLLKVIQMNLHKGIEEGLYRPDIRVDILAKYRLESMMLALNMDVFPPSQFNSAEITIVMIENFLYGVSTEMGHQLIDRYKKERDIKWTAQ
jgi:TetR/AcrR family transcriptional regulator, cholesterol catabolism regulator